MLILAIFPSDHSDGIHLMSYVFFPEVRVIHKESDAQCGHTKPTLFSVVITSIPDLVAEVVVDLSSNGAYGDVHWMQKKNAKI